MEYDNVAEAARRLDEIKPGWRSLVSVGRLDIGCPWGCVTGQVFKEDTVPGWMSGWGYGRMVHGLEGPVFSDNDYLDDWVDEIERGRPDGE